MAVINTLGNTNTGSGRASEAGAINQGSAALMMLLKFIEDREDRARERKRDSEMSDQRGIQTDLMRALLPHAEQKAADDAASARANAKILGVSANVAEETEAPRVEKSFSEARTAGSTANITERQDAQQLATLVGKHHLESMAALEKRIRGRRSEIAQADRQVGKHAADQRGINFTGNTAYDPRPAMIEEETGQWPVTRATLLGDPNSPEVKAAVRSEFQHEQQDFAELLDLYRTMKGVDEYAKLPGYFTGMEKIEALMASAPMIGSGGVANLYREETFRGLLNNKDTVDALTIRREDVDSDAHLLQIMAYGDKTSRDTFLKGMDDEEDTVDDIKFEAGSIKLNPKLMGKLGKLDYQMTLARERASEDRVALGDKAPKIPFQKLSKFWKGALKARGVSDEDVAKQMAQLTKLGPTGMAEMEDLYAQNQAVGEFTGADDSSMQLLLSKDPKMKEMFTKLQGAKPFWRDDDRSQLPELSIEEKLAEFYGREVKLDSMLPDERQTLVERFFAENRAELGMTPLVRLYTPEIAARETLEKMYPTDGSVAPPLDLPSDSAQAMSAMDSFQPQSETERVSEIGEQAANIMAVFDRQPPGGDPLAVDIPGVPRSAFDESPVDSFVDQILAASQSDMDQVLNMGSEGPPAVPPRGGMQDFMGGLDPTTQELIRAGQEGSNPLMEALEMMRQQGLMEGQAMSAMGSPPPPQQQQQQLQQQGPQQQQPMDIMQFIEQARMEGVMQGMQMSGAMSPPIPMSPTMMPR